MNTDYGNNPFANFGSSGSAGVNLEQLFVTGTVAYRLNDSNSIGLGVTTITAVSLMLAQQNLSETV